MERKESWRIGFWNVAGLRNKDEEFWKGLKRWDVMVETWIDRKDWIGIKGRLPRGGRCNGRQEKVKGEGRWETW